MTHVFISYSHQDGAYANALARRLESEGFKVWIDERVDYGSEWPEVIEENLNACAAFILIMSPRAKQSPWVKNEVLHAMDHRKEIFPLLLEGDVWFQVRSFQYVDVRSGLLPANDFYHQLTHYAPQQTAPMPPPPEPERYTLPLLEWIDIPAGVVTLDMKEFYIEAFQIAKYPVTVQQYAAFVDDDGYAKSEFWTVAGRNWKIEKNITLPRFWLEPKWHIDTHPVVGVSWYEALAFCNWLADKNGRGETLASEQEWQRAAEGDDERIFPWGSDLEGERANTHKSKIRQTTPVDQFPKGASGFDVMDMVGNVWEWCLHKSSLVDPGIEAIDRYAPRVMRGGSWRFPKEDLQSVPSSAFFPDYRSNDSGFRLCRPLTLPDDANASP